MIAMSDAQQTEVAAIRGQDAVHAQSFGDCRDRSVDKSEVEIGKFGVEMQRPYEVNRLRRLVFVPRLGVENFRDELAHGGALVPKEVVDFGENERRNDDDAGSREGSGEIGP